MAPKHLGFAVLVFVFVSHQSFSDAALSRAVVPLQYQLSVSIDSEKLTYTANETVVLDIQQVASSISIHSTKAWKMDWMNAIVSCGQQTMKVRNFSSDANDVFTLFFGNELRIGKCLFEMKVENGMSLMETKAIYVSANSRSIITRFPSGMTHNVFPCFDEPQFKAKFLLTVEHNRKYTALSNTKAISNNCIDQSELCVTRFAETSQMAPSSFGFGLTVETPYTSEVHSINYRVFGPIENRQSAYKWAVNYSVNALDQAEQWLGSKCQLKQIDLLSVKNLPSKVDNSWGLIKIREPYLYFNASNPFDVPIGTHQLSAESITNGILSNWLEHDTTPNGDEAFFVSQGLITYIQYLIIGQLKPHWNFMDQFIVQEVQRSLSNANSEIKSEKTAATSASIFRMLIRLVGENVFQNSVRRYLAAAPNGIGQPVNLFNAIQVEVNKAQIKLPATVQQIFKDWFKARDDVPLLNISRNYDNSSTVNITHVKPENFKFIPISLTTPSRPVSDSFLWLAPNQPEINLHKIDANDSQWLLIDNNASGGYYRILYDSKNWRLIIGQLKSKDEIIHAQNRAALINDAVYFAQNGQLSYDIVFELLTYLRDEHDFIPWASAKKALKTYDIMLRGTKAHPHLEGLIHQITTELYPEISVKDQNVKDHVKRLKRLSISTLACEAGDAKCVKDVKEMSVNIPQMAKTVIPELQELVFCAVSRHILQPGSELETQLNNYVMSILRNQDNTDDALTHRAAYGMGCSRNNQLINKALSMTTAVFPPIMNIHVRAADRELLFKALAVGSYEGTKSALIYMNRKYGEMTKLFVSMPSVLKAIEPYITSVELNSLLKDFVKTHHDEFDAAMLEAVASAEAQSQANQEWLTKNHDGMSKWLIANIKVNSSAAASTINFVLIACVTLFYVFLH